MAFQIMKPNDETPELALYFGLQPDAVPDNPAALPLQVLRKFRWTFVIRHPRSSIPSLYRLSMPSRREALLALQGGVGASTAIRFSALSTSDRPS